VPSCITKHTPRTAASTASEILGISFTRAGHISSFKNKHFLVGTKKAIPRKRPKRKKKKTTSTTPKSGTKRSEETSCEREGKLGIPNRRKTSQSSKSMMTQATGSNLVSHFQNSNLPLQSKTSSSTSSTPSSLLLGGSGTSLIETYNVNFAKFTL